MLGRLAPFGPVPATETADDPDDVDPDAVDTSVLRRRPFVSGLLESYWPMAEIVLVAFGTGSILFDGLSQTRPYFDLFGAPQVPLGDPAPGHVPVRDRGSSRSRSRVA